MSEGGHWTNNKEVDDGRRNLTTKNAKERERYRVEANRRDTNFTNITNGDRNPIFVQKLREVHGLLASGCVFKPPKDSASPGAPGLITDH